MDLTLIQSASIAAVKRILSDQTFDVKWDHQANAGYFKPSKLVRMSIVDVKSFPSYIVYHDTGDDILEKEFTDRIITVQHQVENRNQTLVSSSWDIASRIMAGYKLAQIQDIFESAGMAPISPPNIMMNADSLSDHDRWHSITTFEVRFNVRSSGSIPQEFLGVTTAVEYSGSVSGSITAADHLFHINGFVTSAYFPTSSAPTAYLDEGLVHFNWDSEKTTNFNFIFPDRPHAVILTPYSESMNTGGVLFEGIQYSSASFSMVTSAPWSGSIRYRAIYSPKHPNYPATCTSSFSPSSGTISASARTFSSVELIGNPAVNFKSYFSRMNQIPNEFYLTYWDNEKHTAIPVITIDSYNNQSTTGSIAQAFDMPNGFSAGTFSHIAFLTSSA